MREPALNLREPMSGAAQPAKAINADALRAELQRSIAGEVQFDDAARAMYAVDASNYRQVPIGVVAPKTVEDVIATVAACRRHGAPVLSRGAGTSLAGQCCNVAVVVDWTRHLNRILEINPGGEFARVQPGVICDQLRRAAAPHKLTWGPDPATHSHCTFGGMLGNNACGVHAQMAGKAADNVHELDILLYDGTRMRVGWMEESELEGQIAAGGRTGEIYARLKSIRERYAPLVRQRFPKIPRRVSGYNLDELLPGPDGRFNVARALVGTEGTCVTFLEAKVRLLYSQPQRVLAVIGYPDVYQAGDHVQEILPLGPIGLEGFDDTLVQHIAVKNLPQREFLGMLPPGKGWLLVEFGAASKQEAEQQALRLQRELGAGMPVRVYADDADQRRVWQIRELALGANSFVPGEPPGWEGWEDSAVPPARLGDYLRDLRRLFEEYGYHAALYGHFGQGCIHGRISFDLQSAPGIRKFREFLEQACDLVVAYGGSFSGEHGDGQARGEFLHKMFGPELIQAFREFKAVWDPENRMNPGKVVDPYRVDENLRLGAEYRPVVVNTYFRYPDDGGSLEEATLRCVGVGKCRRPEGEGEQNTMCPSFMVTREERHSTRGRAHLLWEMLRGEVVLGGWRDPQVKEALDLCLACKGCKGDCPVNVDVATYKAEFLAHYYEGRLRPLNAYAFGWIDRWARLAAHAPRAANLLTRLPGLHQAGKFALGIAPQRPIPAFARRTFRDGLRGRAEVSRAGPRVLLWADTFNNYYAPHVLEDALLALEAAGHRVEVPAQTLCCGRPLYDQGMLRTARHYLLRVLDALREPVSAGVPVVVLEPSCCSVFRDEMRALLPDRDDARALAAQTFTLAEFLQTNGSRLRLRPLERDAIVQGHCHAKATMRRQQEDALFQALGLRTRVLESGCCGMAGAFGYERHKYALSVACAERGLLPAVREAPASTLIVADGFSCREQIAQLTGRKAVHTAELVRMAASGAAPATQDRSLRAEAGSPRAH